MATKLDYQQGVQDGYQGKPERSQERDYVIGWKQGRIDKIWDTKGGKA